MFKPISYLEIQLLSGVSGGYITVTYTASQPGTHQKIIDMAMNGVGCRATVRIMGVGLNTILRHLKNSGRSR
ncbi:hypothetical protein A6D88_04395 [Klebsiella pneumoniae]|nr:hypothetical protein AGG69_16130 [Klebsiella pneumoniae]MDR8505069.1 hypothetical protein [Klebsiella pneumoniae]OCU08078.1 hypothetical protein A6D88_04395 [Klebsiella pneumoniae]OCU36389.1 hypothetical protein A6D85_04270 [Klebsiella pneumoniae]OCU39037.1 hypothetical protein A6D84_17965 [Klebsiella pneumoniae]